VESKNLLRRIRQHFAVCWHVQERLRNALSEDLAEMNTAGARRRQLLAVSRELRKMGYIVMLNARGTGIVVIERDE
jgi:hypothetical protein